MPLGFCQQVWERFFPHFLQDVYKRQGKARQGVQLVAKHTAGAALHKEVAAGQAGAAQGQVRAAGLCADFVQLFLAQMGGDDSLRDTVFVLVIVGVELRTCLLYTSADGLCFGGGLHYD